MNKKKTNKFLIFFLFTFIASISFVGGYGKGLENKGKDVLWPTEKTKTITSNFGYRKDPFGSDMMFFHNGLDIGAPTGEKIIALEDGEVIRTSFYGGYGYSISFKGKYTNMVYLYGHLNGKFIVKKGMKVKRGDVIGEVGPTNVFNVPGNPYKDFKGRPTNGNTTGAHLHFSVIDGRKFIDPMIFLRKIKNLTLKGKNS